MNLPQRYTPPAPLPVRRVRRREYKQTHPGFLHPLIQTIIQVKNSEDGRGVFVFTGPARAVGVTYVVQVVARELAAETQSRVLIVSSTTLDGASDQDLRRASHGAVECASGVWSLVDQENVEYLPDVLLERVWVDVERSDFDFVLIDCPAVTEAGDALRLAPEADGVFLIVGAGETTRDQVEQAQRVLRYASGHLRGIVLNRRTYPVPKFLYKLI